MGLLSTASQEVPVSFLLWLKTFVELFSKPRRISIAVNPFDFPSDLSGYFMYRGESRYGTSGISFESLLIGSPVHWNLSRHTGRVAPSAAFGIHDGALYSLGMILVMLSFGNSSCHSYIGSRTFLTSFVF